MIAAQLKMEMSMEQKRLNIETFEVEKKCIVTNLNSKHMYQYYVSFSASLLMFASAIHIGWPSPTMPKLLAPDSPIAISSDQGSWMIAVAPLGGGLSIFATLYLLDKFGRKNLLIMNAIPLLISWILVYYADSLIYLIFARLLIGFVFGSSVAILPIYLGEIASNHIRGAIINFAMIMQKCGILFVYLIGPYVKISTLAFICMLPAFGFIILFIWCPESPYYLLKTNKESSAKKNLLKLRNCPSIDIEREMTEITAVTESSSNGHKNRKFKNIFTKNNRNSLWLIIGLSAIGHLCGSHAVIAYAETLFNRVGTVFHGSSATIILGISQTISCIVSSIFVDRIGRRPLFLGSLMAVAICNLTLATYFLIGRYYNVESIAPYIVILIIICNMLYTIGLAPVPAIILGEIFPQYLKAFASVLFVVIGSVSVMISYKLFQLVSDNFGSDCSFLIFSIFCFGFWPYFWQKLPETKGKSLIQIQKELSK